MSELEGEGERKRKKERRKGGFGGGGGGGATVHVSGRNEKIMLSSFIQPWLDM
jgi:hypothetical protein